jgi:UDP-N-acetylmuramyl tripeptide synthase
MSVLSQIRKIIQKMPAGALILKNIRPLGHGLKAFVYAQKYNFPAKRLKIIGITGTKGKTTTTTYLGRMLNLNGIKAGYITTAVICVDGQNEAVNPYKMSSIDSVKMQQKLFEMVKNGCKYAVLEMSSQGLEQNRHWGIFGFDMAIFLNMYPEHIEAHGSFENYLNCKSILFENVRKKGVVLFNADQEFWPQMSYSIKKFIKSQTKKEKINSVQNTFENLKKSDNLNPFYHPSLDSKKSKTAKNLREAYSIFDTKYFADKINYVEDILESQIIGVKSTFEVQNREIFRDFSFPSYNTLKKVLQASSSIDYENQNNAQKINSPNSQNNNADKTFYSDFIDLNLVAEFEIENLYFAYAACSLIKKDQVIFETDTNEKNRKYKLNTAVPGRMEWVLVDSKIV